MCSLLIFTLPHSVIKRLILAFQRHIYKSKKPDRKCKNLEANNSNVVVSRLEWSIGFGATLKVGGGAHNASEASKRRVRIARKEGDVTPN